jgi:hypothetical protein
MSTIVLEHLQHANSTSPDLTVGPGGEIGIGTTSPAHKIDILTSTDQQIPLRIKNSDADSHTYMRFEDNGGQYWDTGINYANNDYYLNYGGTRRARFTNAGGLDVYGSGNSILTLNIGTTAGNYSAVQVGRTDGGGTAYVTAAVTGGVPISGIPGILLGSTNGSLPAVAIQTPNSTNGHIVFNPKGTEKVRITADGDVGIGVIVPTQKLDVNGTVKATAFSGDGSALTGVVPLTVATSAPSTPSVGDQWFDTTAGINAMKVWSGSGWDQMSNKFTATGGTESAYSSGGINYKVHTFTSSGTFTAESAGAVDILVVGGGGGSGSGGGGGGGGGSVFYATDYSLSATSYVVTIGGGGTSYSYYNGTPGNRGGTTTAFGVSGLGGGGGTTHTNTAAPALGANGGGQRASSTSGQSSRHPGSALSATGFTYYGGNSGGNSAVSSSYNGGGGAGAGAQGGDSYTNHSGNGGAGIQINIDGNNHYWAGGGGGSLWDNASHTAGVGGIGGGGGGSVGAGGIPSAGGTGGRNNGGAGTSGADVSGGGAGGANTGGGAGSASFHSGNSAAAGSGIVIVRYVV